MEIYRYGKTSILGLFEEQVSLIMGISSPFEMQN